jgi:hypothetical protein
MRTHRIARLVAILLFLVALVYFTVGTVVGLLIWSRGLGAGWGSGFTGWIAIPILASTLFGAVTLLLFGAMLYFLARIDTNLVLAQKTILAAKKAPPPLAAAAPEPTAPFVPPAAIPAPVEPIVVAAVAAAPAAAAIAEEAAPEPVAEEPTAELPSVPEAVVTEVADEAEVVLEAEAAEAAPAAELPQAEIIEEGELPVVGDEALPEEFTGKLPGLDEASRIAEELAAAKKADKDA